MGEKTFSQAFKENMDSLGLPVPSSIFGTLSTTLATVGALAGAVAKVGAGATVAEIFLTFPVAGTSTAAAAATGEVVAVCGSVAASFYVGACIGSVLVAAYETLPWSELMTVVRWLDEVESKLGRSVVEFLRGLVVSDGRLSPVRTSIDLARLNRTTTATAYA
jgi:hypothetical protein